MARFFYAQKKKVLACLAAGTTTARAAAAAATTCQGNLGGNGKTGTGASIDKINEDLTAGNQQSFFYQEFEAFLIDNFIIIFWLIQSQSQ